MNSLETKYQQAIEALPVPGHGSKYHSEIMRPANYAAMAGIDSDIVFYDLRKIADGGSRKVSDREIRTAIDKAYRNQGRFDLLRKIGVSCSHYKPRVKIDGQRFLSETIKRGREIIGNQQASQWFIDHSPVAIPRLPDPADAASMQTTAEYLNSREAASRDQLRLLLETLFSDWPDAFIFIGGAHDKGTSSTLRPLAQWIDWFSDPRLIPDHIIVNPFTGNAEPKESGMPGETTRRGNQCIKAHRYALIEFDNITLGKQAAFWAAIRLPVAALVFTGNKSIHAWIKVDCADRSSWDRDVINGLYQRLEPAGIDKACKNAARMARPPGAIHAKTLQPAQLIYLDPKARPERAAL